MKKSLVFLLISILGLFLLTGCLVKENVDDELIALKDGLVKFKSGEITKIKSSGVIINLYNNTSKNYTKAYIQSENSDAGVLLYWQDSSIKDKLTVGDLIEFEGAIKVYNGEIEIKPDNYEVKEHNKDVTPKALTSSLLEKWTINGDETTPNMILVTTEGTVLEIDSKTATLTVEDLQTNIIAYLYSGFSGVSQGDKIKVTGILKLYKGEWEIALISNDDYEMLYDYVAPAEVNYSGIAEIKSEIVNGTTEFTDIEGIVVYKSGSVAVINDATTGIYIKEGMDNVSIGDQITFDATGYLDTNNGNIRLKEPTNIFKVSFNNEIKTFELNADLSSKTDWTDFVIWGYKLVKVKGSLSPNDNYTYNLEYNLTDNTTANILVYSKNTVDAANGGTAITSSKDATITGYLAKYKGTWQIYLRDENDVEF
ncbi:hypothetical protein X275_04905 [Marinitoga sp. 1197]|uniref:hypothetical protein n=1 Tax=Marinitoga sp. 1197 TaxID=1428449 RepID=UPI0006410150|nr:hypothetical protein [Marinitoga sp. 1197]KLO22864.1 hypothetical protein X275_04905 [Marinitoga sp. 1197]